MRKVTSIQRTKDMPERVGWGCEFDEPIVLPDGRQLVRLHDAATYITTLPKKEAAEPEWQAAIEALMLVVRQNGPTMFARIGVMRTLNRHVDPERKEHHLGEEKAQEGRTVI